VAGDGLLLVEFFGVPRMRAGRADLRVPAGRVVDVLRAIERECPGLASLTHADGRLAPHYLLSINGERFLADVNHRLQPGDQLLLLSADAGG